MPCFTSEVMFSFLAYKYMCTQETKTDPFIKYFIHN